MKATFATSPSLYSAAAHSLADTLGTAILREQIFTVHIVESNVFTSVYQEFCPQGGHVCLWVWGMYTPLGRHPPLSKTPPQADTQPQADTPFRQTLPQADKGAF